MNPRLDKWCAFEGCGRQRYSVAGWCVRHHQQLKEQGYASPLPPRKQSTTGVCAGPGDCWRRIVGRGLCQGHHRQLLAGEELRPIQTIRPLGATSERDEQGRKQCNRCETWQNESEFYASPHTKDRLGVRCKSCMKDGNLLRLFGISLAQYREMVAQQGGVCASCKRPPSGDRGLAVDHDHSCCPEAGRSCGKCVRGLLCDPCNKGLGHFFDDTERLLSAVQYLNRYRKEVAA